MRLTHTRDDLPLGTMFAEARAAGPEWEELDRRDRGTRFIAIEAKGILNTAAATSMSFWSVNPYIGCEFGCAYCYARDTHRWAVERALQNEGGPAAREISNLPSSEAFERRILVKRNAATLLRRTLNPSRLGRDPLVIGTATDPYQPGERRFGITRALLEALLDYRGLRLGIITKSPLITRDTDLLVQLAARHELTVNLSLVSVDATLLRRLEPRTPTPATRLRAMRKLTTAGIRVGLLIAPIVPGITDGRTALRALIGAAQECGAAWVAGVPLRMGPATRRTLLPWMVRERPALARRYQRHYGAGQAVTRAYGAALSRRLAALQVELGMEPRESVRDRDPLERTPRAPATQLALWEAGAR